MEVDPPSRSAFNSPEYRLRNADATRWRDFAAGLLASPDALGEDDGVEKDGAPPAFDAPGASRGFVDLNPAPGVTAQRVAEARMTTEQIAAVESPSVALSAAGSQTGEAPRGATEF